MRSKALACAHLARIFAKYPSSQDGWMPLHLASRFRRIQASAGTSRSSKASLTVLGGVQVILSLIEHRADPNARGVNGKSPAHCLAQRDSYLDSAFCRVVPFQAEIVLKWLQYRLPHCCSDVIRASVCIYPVLWNSSLGKLSNVPGFYEHLRPRLLFECWLR